MTRRGNQAGTATPGVAGSGWDLIDGDDVIGTASARLLSTCADRGERLAALSLLGLLLDHADEAGRVRLPLDSLARELDVEVDRTVRLLQHLVSVEAVHAQGDAVMVTGTHAGDATLAPYRFLANLMTVLEREPAGSTPSRSAPMGRTAGAVARHDARRHRFRIALGVALAAMAVATAPSGDPATSLRTVAAPSAPDGRAPWATVATTTTTPASTALASEDAPVTTDDPSASEDDAPERSPGPEPRDTTPETTTDQQSQAIPDPSGTQRPTPGRVQPSPPDPPRSVDGAPTQPLPTGPPKASTLPDPPTPPDQGEACPLRPPQATVSSIEMVGAGPSNALDVIGERMVSVRGTVVNAADDAAITVSTVEVQAGLGTDRVVALVSPVPIAIPPGGTATWETTLMAKPAAPLLALVDASVTDWSWSDPDVAAGCPS